MSLLQEMQQYGLADCKFNRKLILLNHFVAVFNEQQQIEDDEPHIITIEQAETDGHFLYWLNVWSDDYLRSKLLGYLTENNA